MKKRFWDILWALFGGLILSLSVIHCYGTVYGMEIPWETLIRWLLGIGLLAGLLLPPRRGSEIVLCLSALVLGYLLRLPQTMGQLKSLLVYASVTLNEVYHWGYFVFPGHTPGTVEIPIVVYGAAVLLTFARCVIRRRGPVLPLLLTVPVLILCILIPEAEPSRWDVFAILATLGLLILPSGTRKNSAIQGRMLTAMAVVPVLLTALVLVLLNPQESYRDRSALWREQLMAKMDFTLKVTPAFTFTPQVSMEEDLAALNGGEKQRLPILTFTAPQDGTVYLRGQDFDTYTGSQWTSDPERSENFDGWGETQGEMTLRTFAVQNVVYLPYYPGTGTILTGGVLENTGGVTSYTFPVYPSGSAMTGEALDKYLRLPESTRAWAREYLNGVTDPQTIGELVKNSALYDLSTPRMPENEEDFAKWFLEESDRGFCVHFATASTVLLRAAGIPARYVTGFCKEAQADKAAMVTTLDAHAWAEYYDTAEGCWKILESTASQATASTASQARETEAPSVAPERDTLPGETHSEEPIRETVTKKPVSLWLLVLPGLVVLLFLRRYTILLLRRGAIRRADTKKRTLLYWHQAEDLAGALGQDIPENLLELAQRAKFSPHRITALDLAPLKAYIRDCCQELKKAPWWRRLLDTLWFVRY